MKSIFINEAIYQQNYKIYRKFNDGGDGVVDLQNKLKGPIFGLLLNVEYFKSFHLNTWILEWPNGADLAPEFLYELVLENQSVS